MAEASLSMQLKANNVKKRKTETGQMAKNKKALSNCSNSDDINVIAATDMERMEINHNHNQVYKKNYHLGGHRYLVFYGPHGSIEDIFIEE